MRFSVRRLLLVTVVMVLLVAFGTAAINWWRNSWLGPGPRFVTLAEIDDPCLREFLDSPEISRLSRDAASCFELDNFVDRSYVLLFEPIPPDLQVGINAHYGRLVPLSASSPLVAAALSSCPPTWNVNTNAQSYAAFASAGSEKELLAGPSYVLMLDKVADRAIVWYRFNF